MALTFFCWSALLLWGVCTGNPNTCASPRSAVFKSCGRDTGTVTPPSLQVLSVTDATECVLQCVNSARCVGVAVQTSAVSSELKCELYSAPTSCDDVGHRVGHQFYMQADVYRPCVTRSPVVRGAVRRDAVYTLFTDTTLQEFVLAGASLYAVDCPQQISEAFVNWRTSLRVDAAAYSYAFGHPRIFFVHNGTVVEGFLESKVLVEFDPPKSLSTFFGGGISGNVRALVAEDDKFHVYTENGIYTSKVPSTPGPSVIVEHRQPLHSPEFNWTALTAATFTSDSDVMMLFFGDTYVLYNSENRTVVGRGEVCINSFPELMP